MMLFFKVGFLFVQVLSLLFLSSSFFIGPSFRSNRAINFNRGRHVDLISRKSWRTDSFSVNRASNLSFRSKGKYWASNGLSEHNNLLQGSRSHQNQSEPINFPEFLENDLFIIYSHPFQKYLVVRTSGSVGISDAKKILKLGKCHVVGEYSFLDDAIDRHRDATAVVSCYDESAIAGYCHVSSAKKCALKDRDTKRNTSPKRLTLTKNDLAKASSVLQEITSLTHLNSDDVVALATIVGPHRLIAQPCSIIIQGQMNKKYDGGVSAKKTVSTYQKFEQCMRVLTGNWEEQIDENDGIKFSKEWVQFDSEEARQIISNFPQLLLYEPEDLFMRIKFMLAPENSQAANYDSSIIETATNLRSFADTSRRNKINEESGARRIKTSTNPSKRGPQNNWVEEFFTKGTGVGMSSRQVTEAIRVTPQILSMFFEDSKKPPLLYYYKTLNINPLKTEETLQNIPSLTGCDARDICFFTYLHFSLDVCWNKCRMLVESFPTFTYFDEHLQPESNSRKRPGISSSSYIRTRLQLKPGEMSIMTKAHPQLLGYRAETKIEPTLNEIQSSLGLTCRQVQKLIFSNPSLLGVKVVRSSNDRPSFHLRRDFFIKEVGLTEEELRTVILQLPPLLQYGLDSILRPKIFFLTKSLNIDCAELPKIIMQAPSFLGLSLTQTLQPKVEYITKACDLSYTEFGEVVRRAPQILERSLYGKIVPCIKLLTSLLKVQREREVGQVILQSPKILMHSGETSLLPKYNYIRDSLEKEGCIIHTSYEDMSSDIVRLNPSLLVLSWPSLRDRVERGILRNGATLQQALLPRHLKKLKGSHEIRSVSRNILTNNSNHARSTKRRKVALVTDDFSKILREYSSVKVAAEKTRISSSSISLACRKGCRAKGKRFVYIEESGESSTDIERRPNKKLTMEKKTQRRVMESTLTVVASGRIYTSEQTLQKTGGIGLYLPGTFLGAPELQKVVSQCYGLIVPEVSGGSNYQTGCISLPFQYPRPSRKRCEIYACHAALKIIGRLLADRPPKGQDDIPDIDAVKIFTSSGYAIGLLHDSNRLKAWAKIGSDEIGRKQGHSNDDALPYNADLLLPLVTTFSRISLTGVPIEFCSTSELHDVDVHDTTESLAKYAAIWQYERDFLAKA